MSAESLTSQLKNFRAPRFAEGLKCLIITLVLFISTAQAQTCAAPGRDGPVTVTGAVNTYFPPANGTYTAASTAIALGASRGAAVAIAPGDLVVVMQMQCAAINTTNTANYGAGNGTGRGYTDPAASCLAGQYEYVRAGAATTATSLDLTGSPLTATYIQDATTATNRRTFQVIRVPQYSSVTLSGTVNAPFWDGNTGGVVLLDAAGTLNFGGGTVDVAGRGFRGAGGINWPGTVDADTPPDYVATIASTQHALKGEGIAGTPRYVYSAAAPAAVTDLGAAWGGYAAGDAGRGAPGNAGGGGDNRNNTRDNGGGGGGGNGGIGGFGGYGYKAGGWGGTFTAADFDLRGIGGAAFASPAPSRVVMGGGGGSGGSNSSGANPVATSGGAGGGIVILRAGSMAGTGSILANGAAGQTNPINDGAGGGGAGGSVVLMSASGAVGTVAINAAGGAGGNSDVAGTLAAHSPGGGGGAGVVLRSAAVTGTFTGGAAGTTNLAGGPVGGATHGATAGGAAVNNQVADAAFSGVRPSAQCLPALTASKLTTTPLLSAPGATTAAYAIVVSNAGGAASGADLIDNALPPGWTFASSAAITFSPPRTATLLGGFVEGATPGQPAVANSAGTVANLAVNGAPADAPIWSNITIPGISSGVPGVVTLSFVVNIPATAPVGCFHNPAGVKYIDPTRITAGREITPAANSTANRAGAQVGGTVNTAYESAPGLSSTVLGSNYSGLAGGPTTEDVCLQGDLSVIKTVSPTGAVPPGGTLTYTLSPRNNGRLIRDLTFAADQATDAANANIGTRVLANGSLQMVDTLPAGLAPTIGFFGTDWTCNQVGQVVTCNRAATAVVPLAAATTLTGVVGTVLVTQAACGTGPLVNNVSLTGFQAPYTDSLPANNTASVTSPAANCNANLTVAKTNGTNAVTAGGTTSYTVNFANAGPSSADGAVVRDVTSAGLACTVASCTASGGAICPAPLADLLAPAGTAIATFPAGGGLQYAVNCNVTATGQ